MSYAPAKAAAYISAMSAAGLKRIGFLGFDGVAAIDLTGTLEAFRIADGADWRQPPRRYETLIIGLSDAPFTAESGVRMLADVTLEAAPELDTIIIPGGPGLRTPATNRTVADWLKIRSPRARRVASICTGLYGLAASGLMDGRRATTHWLHAADAASRFPTVEITPDAIYVKDGPFYTSAGMTAGIDLALAMIEEDHGPAVALAAARQLVVYMKRSGGQLQYSEPLKFQTRASDRFANLSALIVGDPAADWTVETMAATAGLSPRQFSRRFREALGASPAAFVEALRLDEARLRLATTGDSIARVAHAAGFRSDDVFRRAFERRFGVTPSAYRDRFAPAAPFEITSASRVRA